VLESVMLYPLAICAVCILTSIIGTFFVKLGANGSIMGALYKGLIATGVLSIIGLGDRDLADHRLGPDRQPPRRRRHHRHEPVLCGVIGLVVTGLIVWITEYYTGTNFRPVARSPRPRSPATAPTSSRASRSRWNRRRCRRS
jgi:K(+)-stimulated pyrophosphate-energized sodium pump